MGLRTREVPDGAATLGIEEAGQVHNKEHDYVYIVADLSAEVYWHIRSTWCSSDGDASLEYTTDGELRLS